MHIYAFYELLLDFARSMHTFCILLASNQYSMHSTQYSYYSLCKCYGGYIIILCIRARTSYIICMYYAFYILDQSLHTTTTFSTSSQQLVCIQYAQIYSRVLLLASIVCILCIEQYSSSIIRARSSSAQVRLNTYARAHQCFSGSRHVTNSSLI